MAKFQPPAETAPELPRIFYDGRGQHYWIEDSGGNWIQINETAVKRELKAAGYDSTSQHGANSECDEALRKLQADNSILFAGGVAGYDRGPCLMLGKQILVTTAASVVQPDASVQWPMIEGIVGRMFQDNDVIFYSWCKVAYECLYHRAHKPGQVIVFAGDPGCGKSFLQNVLLHYLLGGRTGTPYRYMTGGSTFNSDYFNTEHLMIGDEAVGSDMKTRMHLGKELKKIAAERVHSCHPKGRDAFPMTPYWRCSITLNTDGENIMVLPPIGHSLEDKIIMLKVHGGTMPMPTRTGLQEEKFREAILDEMPGFVHWLLEIEIPAEVADERYGVRGYQDPDLMFLLEEHSPEEKLWDLLVHVLGSMKVDGWEGSTSELEELLCTASDAAKKLFYFSSACGVYMARLVEKKEVVGPRGRVGRVTRPRTRGYWKIEIFSEKGPRTPTTPTT